MIKSTSVCVSLFCSALLAACHDAAEHPEPGAAGSSPAAAAAGPEAGHAHAEEPLGTVTIGDLSVTLAQGHGAVIAGQEAHLVVKLPYSDSGSTVVRAWIGSEDRTLSFVGKGEFAAEHDDYDVHASAPDPLPENSRWWIEIEQPDGTKLVGSAQPILN